MTTSIAECLERGGSPLPWLYGLAARLEGEGREAMLTDAGALSRSLATAADLFDLPAVCASLDTTLEAEAVGCVVDFEDGDPRVVEGCIDSVDGALELDVDALTDAGRVPAILDATDRLVSNFEGTSVLGGVTGPRRLGESLLVEAELGIRGNDYGDDELRHEATLTASDLAIELANAYLDRGADGIAVLEPDGVKATDRYFDAMTPLANVIDHYDAVCVVVQRAVDGGAVSLVSEVGFDAVTGRVDDRTEVLGATDDAGVAVGVGIPPERFLAGPDAVDAFASELPAGTWLSSEWEVPETTDPETIHRLMGSL